MQLAFEYPTGTFPRNVRLVPELASREELRQDIKILGMLLIVLQVMDGVLTAMGVHLWGTNAEGNALIRYLMEALGFIPALVLVKSLAIVIVVMLCALSNRITWVGSALKTVIAIYLFAAIAPWAVILALHHA